MPDQEPFFGCQPVWDRQNRLFAHALLFRATGHGRGERLNGCRTSAHVIRYAVGELQIASSLHKSTLFIKVDESALQSALVVESMEPRPPLIGYAPAPKAQGSRVASDAFLCGDAHAQHAPVELADVIEIDAGQRAPDAGPGRVRRLKGRQLECLAEKVETPAQAQDELDARRDLFQGASVARPHIIAGDRLAPSRLRLPRLLTAIMEAAEVTALEDRFKRAPALSYRPLRRVNSAAARLSRKIFPSPKPSSCWGNGRSRTGCNGFIYHAGARVRAPAPIASGGRSWTHPRNPGGTDRERAWPPARAQEALGRRARTCKTARAGEFRGCSWAHKGLDARLGAAAARAKQGHRLGRRRSRSQLIGSAGRRLWVRRRGRPRPGPGHALKRHRRETQARAVQASLAQRKKETCDVRCNIAQGKHRAAPGRLG